MSLYQRVQYLDVAGSVDVPAQSSGGGPLGSGLFITPRTFTYNTYAGPGVFNLDRQGLMSLMAFDPTPPWGVPYADGGFRVVTKPDGTMDVLPFMRAMSWLCSYGSSDEGLTHSARLTAARDRFLELRCGPVTAFTMACASSVGIQTRQMHLLDISNPVGDGLDDGHVICEAMVDGAWRAFDVPNDIAFADQAGALLSLKDVITAGVGNCTQVILAPSDVGRDSPTWVQTYYAATLATPADKAKWLSRIYEIPGVAVGNGIVWGVPGHLASFAPQIANYPGASGWTTLPWAQWVATYY